MERKTKVLVKIKSICRENTLIHLPPSCIGKLTFLKHKPNEMAETKQKERTCCKLASHGQTSIACWTRPRAADTAVPSRATATETRQAVDAALSAKAPAQSREGGATQGDAPRGEEAAEGRDLSGRVRG